MEGEFRQHLVVAVGSPLPTSSQPAGTLCILNFRQCNSCRKKSLIESTYSAGLQQGPVLLTAKNLQCMRAILSVAHCHGAVLGSSWHLVLTTLQVLLGGYMELEFDLKHILSISTAFGLDFRVETFEWWVVEIVTTVYWHEYVSFGSEYSCRSGRFTRFIVDAEPLIRIQSASRRCSTSPSDWCPATAVTGGHWSCIFQSGLSSQLFAHKHNMNVNFSVRNRLYLRWQKCWRRVWST